ncbi:MAG TPA: hypothetical protein PKC91_00595 [Ignavibacteria bacterium]|nr:hypothetical protein [Ignavibacteria bacterium]
MHNNFDKYTGEVKQKLDKNYLSPLFIRFANLLYANEHFEECISVCKTGLEIYPEYLTAKLILLKAFMKCEYLNEAEVLFSQIRSKLTNIDLLSKLESNIQNLKAISKQEKIYYTTAARYKYDYRAFEKKYQPQENLFTEFSLNDFFDEDFETKALSSKEYQDFLNQFESFHFEKNTNAGHTLPEIPVKKHDQTYNSDNLLHKIKIVTETLADIYAQQGNFKEAFDAYNILIRAGSSNRKRIEEKLNELERGMNRQT